MDFSNVVTETKEPYLIVKHKLFSLPVADYEASLKTFLDPYSEEAVQTFVEKYLQYNQDPGIVGLVGLERKEGQVFIDAAVRYEAKED